MKQRALGSSIATIALVWLAAGCNLQVGAAGPQTWIDAPLDGSTLELATVLVRSHAAANEGTAQAELLVNGASVRVDSAVDGANPLVEFSQPWTPNGPGDYALQVISTDHTGHQGRSNIVHVHIGGEAPAVEPPTPVPGAPPTPTDTPTSPPPTGPAFTFDKNGNCREGDSTVYEVVTSFQAGQQLPIAGRNSDNSWFWLTMPGGDHCWASSGTGVPIGPFASAPLIQPPLPPIATTEAAPPPPPPPPAAPNAPGKFSVQELQCTASGYVVGVLWNDVSGEDGYRVYRDGSLIGTLGAGATEYDDKLPDFNAHGYRVEAFNGSGSNSTGVKNSTGCVY